jgi:hypothetical protein
MNHALRRVSLACLAMFLLLLVNANFVQGFEAGKLADDPGNGRTFAQQYQYQRGSIVTADNVPIAQSKHVSGVYSFQRSYPAGATYAPVTGYDTPYSKTGTSRPRTRGFAGTDPLAVRSLIDLVTGSPTRGDGAAHHQLRCPEAAYQALKATGPRRRRRHRPERAPSWRWPPIRRSTPTGWPRSTARPPTGRTRGTSTPRGSRCPPPGDQRTFPARVHVQGWTGSAAFSSGKYNPDSRFHAPTNLAARHDPPAHQLRQLAVRRRQPDRQRDGPADLRLHRVLQHGLRRPGRKARRRRCASRPTRSDELGTRGSLWSPRATSRGCPIPTSPPTRRSASTTTR